MSWEHEIANIIKQRPPEKDGYHKAEVVELNPVKLSLFNGELYILQEAMDKTEKYRDLERLPQTDPDCLKIGQQIAVIGKQKYLILDRVVG